MVRTVIKRNLKINQRKAGQNALVQSLADTFLNRTDELLRNCSSPDSIDELKSFPTLKRLNPQPNMTILTTSTRLPDIFAFCLGCTGNSFFIGNLGTTNININTEFPPHSINDDFKMKLAHARDYGFS